MQRVIVEFDGGDKGRCTVMISAPFDSLSSRYLLRLSTKESSGWTRLYWTNQSIIGASSKLEPLLLFKIFQGDYDWLARYFAKERSSSFSVCNDLHYEAELYSLPELDMPYLNGKIGKLLSGDCNEDK